MVLGVKYDVSRDELLPFLPKSAERVLDVGCGGGGFGRAIMRSHPHVAVWGVEPDPASVEMARHSGYETVLMGTFPDVMVEDHNTSFDVIFFNDVLEHMPDPSRALEFASQLVNTTGKVVASIPNVRHLSVWWPLIRYGRWDYTEYGILDRTHVRFFTRKTMVELFNSTGWQVTSITGITKSRRPWPFEPANSWKIRFIGWLTAGRSDEFLFAQYVLEAER